MKTIVKYGIFVFLLIGCSNTSENKKIVDNDSVSLDSEINSIAIIDEFNKKDSLIVEEDSVLSQMDAQAILDDSTLTRTGIVRYSGLGRWYKGGFGFESKYQLQSKGKGFYLITDLELIEYLGKCVKIKGTFLTGWDLNTEEVDGLYTYGLTAISLDSIQLIDADSCNNSINFLEIKMSDEHLIRDTLEGYIQFSKRPSPDIGYDYKFELKTPIFHPEDSSCSITYLPFITRTISLTEINNLISDKSLIKVYGGIKGGASESVIFRCEKYEKLN